MRRRLARVSRENFRLFETKDLLEALQITFDGTTLPREAALGTIRTVKESTADPRYETLPF